MDVDTLPEEAGIGRVTLTVSAFDAVVPFYRDAVGLTVRERDAERALLGTDETTLLVLEAEPDATERPTDAAGLFHTAFLFPSRGALGDALVRVREAGARLTGASDHLVSEALYLRDPEGNGVELYRDRPRADWPESDGRVEMDTLALDTESLAADRAGEPAAGAPDETTVGHVHLEVTDLGAAEEVYADGLGFGVRQRWGGAALFLAAGGYHHHVGLNTWNGRTAPATGRGLESFEVTVPDESALAAVRDRLERISTSAADIAGTADGFVVTDPDGIRVRVRSE